MHYALHNGNVFSIKILGKAGSISELSDIKSAFFIGEYLGSIPPSCHRRTRNTKPYKPKLRESMRNIPGF